MSEPTVVCQWDRGAPSGPGIGVEIRRLAVEVGRAFSPREAFMPRNGRPKGRPRPEGRPTRSPAALILTPMSGPGLSWMCSNAAPSGPARPGPTAVTPGLVKRFADSVAVRRVEIRKQEAAAHV